MTVARSDLGGPPVLPAVHCPAGHLNSPQAVSCRVCHRTVPQQEPTLATRPPLGELHLSTGQSVVLDQGVVIGRHPHLTGGTQHLVAIPEERTEVSGQHVEFTLVDFDVRVRDLGSTYGTQVIAPDRSPRKLRHSEEATIEPGTKVRLADVVDVVFEATP